MGTSTEGNRPELPGTVPPGDAGADNLLAFLAGLATDLAAVLELPALLAHIIRAMRVSLGFDSSAVALLERRDGEEELVIKAGSGLREGLSGLTFRRGEGLIWEVLETQSAVLVPDLHADPRIRRKDPGVRSGIYAPLVSRNHPLGVLSAYRPDVDGFALPDLHLLTVVARYIAGAVELGQLHDALRIAATTDSLTGLANRRACMERLGHEIARSERTRRPLALAVIDLDGFKAINDTYGHAAGDAHLVATAGLLRGPLRSIDFLARHGGDEFVVLFPETGGADAEIALRRVADAHADGRLPTPIPLQFSWGVATWPADGTTADDLLRAADARLYGMKHDHGRLIEAHLDRS